ncbi:MAG: helix-turn-helix domain-containing protein [Clostridia bacterium]|nr:helix-turn-helix domain-containing protein [Clostridia bacterium]
MKNEYIRYTERMFFKHEISKNLPKNVYSTHTHNVYELLYILGGDATCVIENRKYKLKKGDLILIRPFRYHFIQIDSTTDYERYDILFDPTRHHVEGVSLIGEDVEVVSLAENAIAKNIFQRMDVYRERCDEKSFETLLSHLVTELFYSVHLFSNESVGKGKSLSPLISDALQYMNESLYTIRSMEEVAAHLFISESYLFRRFKNELHQTPKQYMMNKRLLLARQHISLGEAPTEVCQRLGFGDYTTFYRNYRAFFGQAPTGRLRDRQGE